MFTYRSKTILLQSFAILSSTILVCQLAWGKLLIFTHFPPYIKLFYSVFYNFYYVRLDWTNCCFGALAILVCKFFPSKCLQEKIYLYRCPWWRRPLHCCLARPLQCRGAKTSLDLFLCLVAPGRRCRLPLPPWEKNILIRQPPHPGENNFSPQFSQIQLLPWNEVFPGFEPTALPVPAFRSDHYAICTGYFPVVFSITW